MFFFTRMAVIFRMNNFYYQTFNLIQVIRQYSTVVFYFTLWYYKRVSVTTAEKREIERDGIL